MQASEVRQDQSTPNLTTCKTIICRSRSCFCFSRPGDGGRGRGCWSGGPSLSTEGPPASPELTAAAEEGRPSSGPPAVLLPLPPPTTTTKTLGASPPGESVAPPLPPCPSTLPPSRCLVRFGERVGDSELWSSGGTARRRSVVFVGGPAPPPPPPRPLTEAVPPLLVVAEPFPLEAGVCALHA